jgi:hypothetical protein
VQSASSRSGNQSSVADEPEAAEWAMQGNLSAHIIYSLQWLSLGLQVSVQCPDLNNTIDL